MKNWVKYFIISESNLLDGVPHYIYYHDLKDFTDFRVKEDIIYFSEAWMIEESEPCTIRIEREPDDVPIERIKQTLMEFQQEIQDLKNRCNVLYDQV